MLDGWILGENRLPYMWPESEGDAGERSQVRLQNGTEETSHVKSEFMKALEPDQPTSFGPWAGITSYG